MLNQKWVSLFICTAAMTLTLGCSDDDAVYYDSERVADADTSMQTLSAPVPAELPQESVQESLSAPLPQFNFGESQTANIPLSEANPSQRAALPALSVPANVPQGSPASSVLPELNSNEIQPQPAGEDYNSITENRFLGVEANPLSTFSIDVDSASYSNMRRFLNDGIIPLPDAIRIEELINYFHYDYPQPDPECDCPFFTVAELSEAPWNEQHKLVHVGIQGREIATEDLPPSNLVFLLDVSGSMSSPDKLPLLKSAFQLLVQELDGNDRVSIVVYAGSAGVVLDPTSGLDKQTILEALERLEAGGSTAGGQGIQLAYALAEETFIPDGNNRVILATDGDFNVGVSSESALVRLIEEKRDQAIFLTVLGFGTGNLQDSKMEQIANHGNGNYAYIDSVAEARKVLVQELGATLLTIAKDVKIQIEFNPAKVQAYRLIGYENRILAAEDFNDDTKDAGELGAGHSVTALYEIIPAGVEADVDLTEVDDLRYQPTPVEPAADFSDELMLLKLRYKDPTADTSKLLATPVVDQGIPLERTSPDFRFSAAVAGFGMVLRDSDYKGAATPLMIEQLATEALGPDLEGYRSEFLELVQRYQGLISSR